MNVRLVYVSADHKGMIAFGKTPCKFYAQPVCFFRGNLTGAAGLAYMIGNHIICATHSSCSGNVLPLCQKELCIRSPTVTRIAGNEPAIICFLWIYYIIDDVTDRPTFCAVFANMKRHDSCGCHNASSSPNTKAATQRIFIVEVTAFCHYAHFMFFYYSKIQPAHRLSLPDYCLGRSQQPDLWLISPLVLLRTE